MGVDFSTHSLTAKAVKRDLSAEFRDVFEFESTWVNKLSELKAISAHGVASTTLRAGI
jgi:hypothetical protein